MPKMVTLFAPSDFNPLKAGDFAARVQKACQNSDIVTVDMSKVTFISSSGIGVLIHAWKSMSGDTQKFILKDLSPVVHQVLTDCNLIKIFSIQGESA